MERAMCGSRSRLRSFWRVLVWLNLTCSPSQPNHTGLFCGSAWGPMVATCATAARSRRSWNLLGIIDRSPLVFSVLSPPLVIPALGWEAVFYPVLLAPDVVTHVWVAHGLEHSGALLRGLAWRVHAVDDDLGFPVGHKLRGAFLKLVYRHVDRARQVRVAIIHLRQRVDQDEVVPRSNFSLSSS